jgi:hypothetical protein
LAQLAGRYHRPPGMILVRHRGTKQRHKALAQDLEEGAAVVLHRVLGQRQHIVHQVVHRL